MLKRFVSYYKPYKGMFALDMAASFCISLIGMIYPMITRVMLNDYVVNSKLQSLLYAGALLLVLYGVRMGLRYFVQYYGHMIGVQMQAQMRREMFAHLEKLPYSYYDNHETGKIMSRMTNDLMDVSELAHHGPENFLISGVMIIGSFIYLCTINATLTLIIFACVPLLVIISLFLRKRMRDAFMDSRKSIAAINASVQSSISGIRVTKAFNNDQKEQEKFEEGNHSFIHARSDAYKAMALFHSSTSFITDIFNVIVLVAGGLFIYNGKISLGDYSAFIVSVNLFISPLTTLIQFMEQYQNGVTGFQRFLEIVDEPIEKQSPDATDAGVLQGDVTFDHVSFSYETGQKILDDVSLHCAKGETLALVGPSGGGKTTICHLLPGFYPLSQGSIQIDGIDIRHMTFESLRRNIGIVQQDVFLFNGTIYENILYGKLDADEQQVYEAAKQADIYDYIVSLPDGFQTEIGERGVRLSGGQKQRLAIARVFLKNPAILILDEATSALDNTAEVYIQKALDTLSVGRTVLVVAHRLSTIRNADQIAVVQNGRITEKGSHKELLNKNGEYSRLYRLQFRDSDSIDMLNEAMAAGD